MTNVTIPEVIGGQVSLVQGSDLLEIWDPTAPPPDQSKYESITQITTWMNSNVQLASYSQVAGLGNLATANTTNILNNSYIYAADTGSANAYVAVLSPAAISYVAGMKVVVKIANANTGASTLALNALSAKSIKNLDGSALGAGDVGVGQEAIFIYDGTNFQLINALVSGAGNGDVIGPASATDTAIAKYNGTTGKLIENSGVTIDSSNNISGVAGFSFTSFVVMPKTSITTSTYTVLSTDLSLLINFSGAQSTTIPTATGSGRLLIVKDKSQMAGTNNITVVPVSGTIDGQANYVINTNGGSITLHDTSSADWSIY